MCPRLQQEERRIAFVALTRAKETLTIYRPRMNAQNAFTSMSEFEPVIAGYVDLRRHVRKTAAGDARVETGRRIDMRAALTGGLRRK